MDRLETLLEMYKNMKEDPFIPYAIALEYVSKGDTQNAQKFLSATIEGFPDYLPVYYHLSEFHFKNKDILKGTETASRGIELAKKLKNFKTASELENLIEDFED